MLHHLCFVVIVAILVISPASADGADDVTFSRHNNRYVMKRERGQRYLRLEIPEQLDADSAVVVHDLLMVSFYLNQSF